MCKFFALQKARRGCTLGKNVASTMLIRKDLEGTSSRVTNLSEDILASRQSVITTFVNDDRRSSQKIKLKNSETQDTRHHRPQIHTKLQSHPKLTLRFKNFLDSRVLASNVANLCVSLRCGNKYLLSHRNSYCLCVRMESSQTSLILV